MAAKWKMNKWEPEKKRGKVDPNRPRNKNKRMQYKKYRGQGR